MLSLTRLRARFPAAILAIAVILRAGYSAGVPPEFARDIQPILAANCYSCHGATRSMGGIRLDARAGASRLWRIAQTDHRASVVPQRRSHGYSCS
jgi:hypothetical protein